MAVKEPAAVDAPRVKCPSCGVQCHFAPSNPWRPFCSERCRSIDLGAWASERYRVSTGPETRDEPDASADPS